MKQITDFLSKNFTSLIIIGLFIFIIFRDCGGKRDNDLVPKRDTVESVVYHIYKDTVVSQPKITLNIPATKADIPGVMMASAGYEKLLKQYDSLLNLHYSRNIQEDSLRIDSFGYVKTKDQVYGNKIITRDWITDLKIPERTTTITIHEPYKPKNQVYIGGGLMGNETNILRGVKGGFMIKNKKDQLYGFNASHIFKYGNVYELSYYMKLKLGK